MPARRLASLLTALVVLAAPVAACGDDDEETLTESQLLDRANEICADMTAELDAIGEDVFADAEEEPSPAVVGDFFRDRALPTIREHLDELRELEGPDDLQADVDALVDDVEEVVDELGDLDDEELFERITSGEDPFEALNERSVELGLNDCAE